MRRFKPRRRALEKACQEVPGAARFLNNFFLSAEGGEMHHVYMNYLNDLGAYAPTNRAIRENMGYLREVFPKVAGMRQADFESFEMVYGRAGMG